MSDQGAEGEGEVRRLGQETRAGGVPRKTRTPQIDVGNNNNNNNNIRRTEGTEEQGVSDPQHLSFLAS